MYIRQKHATLHKYFIIFNTQSQKLYLHQKILTKSAATVAFVRKVAQGSSFKKDSQFHSNLCICM